MSKSNESIYETDFEAGKVKEIYANYHGDPYSFSTEYPLEEKLGKEAKRLSTVPIRNVQDVYNALTDRETLNEVLAKYFWFIQLIIRYKKSRLHIIFLLPILKSLTNKKILVTFRTFSFD
jgi:hypothetical protein